MTIRHLLAVTTTVLGLAACTSGSEPVDVPVARVATSASDSAVATDATIDTDSAPDATVPSPTSTSAPFPSSTVPPPTTTTPPPATTTGPPPTGPATTARAPDFLRQGDEDPRVGIIQLKLSVLGYLPPNSDTGIFDAATNGAVLAFQGDYGLVVDGVIGPQTERAISAAAESVNPEN